VSQINPVHVSHPTTWRPISKLSSHLRLRFPSDLFPTRFSIKILYVPLPPPLGASCHSLLFSQTLSSEWCLVRNTDHKAPRYVVFSTPLVALFRCDRMSSSASYSRTLSVYFSPSMRDLVSHPQKARDKTINFIFYFSCFFFYSKLQEKILPRLLATIPRVQSVLNSSSNGILIFAVVTKYLHYCTLAKDLLPVYMLWYSAAHNSAWCWNLDNWEIKSEVHEKFWNVVLEKDGEDKLDWSCEKWRSIIRV
jgi:hypothetical protein